MLLIPLLFRRKDISRCHGLLHGAIVILSSGLFGVVWTIFYLLHTWPDLSLDFPDIYIFYNFIYYCTACTAI